MKENLLVSSCLLGNNTKYNGKNNYIDKIELIKEKYNVIVICPEVMGGLSIPRNPSEILGDKVISSEGVDVTKEFVNGSIIACELAKKHNVTKALLKNGSPSCGKNKIYDGSFSGVKIVGSGVAASMLAKQNIIIYSEDEIDELL